MGKDYEPRKPVGIPEGVSRRRGVLCSSVSTAMGQKSEVPRLWTCSVVVSSQEAPVCLTIKHAEGKPA